MPTILRDLWKDLRRSFQKDPTADWPAVAAAPLVFDLARRELNGVPLGGAYTLLRRFGRPGNPRPFLCRQLGFPPLGLEAYLGPEDEISGFACVFSREMLSGTEMEAEADFSPCSIELRLPAFVRVQVTPRTTRADLKPLLGEPQEDTGVLGYRYPGVHLGFEFDREDRLRVLDLEPGSPGDPDQPRG